jgi:hypothetical protein
MLSLSNAMRQFNSRESNYCRPKGLESQHRCAPLFDSPMVLLNHVVEISTRTHFHLPPAGIFLTKRLQTSKGRFIAIDVDFLRPWDSSIGDGCSEKCLRGLLIAIIAEQRPNGFSVLVHGPK